MDIQSTNICQCCLTKACYKNINNEYYWAGEIVVYSDLLKYTFNISTPSVGCDSICDNCVTRLQDACVFRRQVVQAQLQMQELLVRNDLEEKEDNDEASVGDSVESINSFLEDDCLWDSNNSMSEIDTIYCNNNTTDNKSSKVKENISIECDRTLRNEDMCTDTPEKPKRFKIKKEVRDDSLKLLKYSNICLFKSLKTKYQCCICKEAFIKISGLREHSKSHLNSKNTVNLTGHSYKNADISFLTCSLCSEQCNDLNTLAKHLLDEHEIEFTTREHIFIPYKLEEGFKCVICEDSFNTFVRLSTHMNTHSTNNVCESCGLFFINRLSLRTHVQSMHKIKHCTLCNAKFDKNYEKLKHMKIVHNIGTSKRYCAMCGQTFRHSYMLLEHRIKEHGAKRPISNCSQCNKTFLTPQNLKVHIRSVHAMERNYQCDKCGMTFFTKRDETRHKKRHEDTKSFSCSHCDGKFKSKDSWRRHLRRLHSIDC